MRRASRTLRASLRATIDGREAMKRAMIGVLAVMSALALGAACEQNPPGSAQRGGPASAPTARGPGGGTATGSSDMNRGTAPSAGTASSSDLSGTGGAGDAGMGRADAGTKMK
ncbi:MAG TPA: hypothetical protein VFE93_00245 [Myxococcaceae bacterium]|nr:hypothetical protein [Myxococcaceae bacterium]